jgi:hypothetical protein
MNAKKLFAIFVLFAFLASIVPLAAAERGGNGANGNSIEANDIDSSTDSGSDDNESDDSDDSEDDEPEPTVISARQTTQERSRLRTISYDEAKEKYARARERLDNVKQAILQKKTELKECRGLDSDECANVRKDTKAKSKDFLGNAADKILAMLQKVRARIAESDMTEEEKAGALADLDAKIAEIESAQGVIEGINENSSKAEIQDAIKAVKDAWSKSKNTAGTEAGRLMNEKIHGITVKAEKLGEKLERIRDNLAAKGYDVSAIDAALEDFNANIALANENYASARAKYAATASATDKSTLMQEANNLMREAHKNLKDAHQSLMEAFRAVKAQKGGEEALESEETEDEPQIKITTGEDTETDADDENETESDDNESATA